MTEVPMSQVNNHAVIGDALALIDKGLFDMRARDMVTTTEVADLLLDVRLLLSAVEEPERELSASL